VPTLLQPRLDSPRKEVGAPIPRRGADGGSAFDQTYEPTFAKLNRTQTADSVCHST